MITHTTSRRRLPAILGRFRGHFGVDTVDLVLDLLADQPNQLGDVGAVEIPRVRQGHVDRTADAPGVRMKDHDLVRQAHRLADRVGDEQDRLVRLDPQLLELRVQPKTTVDQTVNTVTGALGGG